MRNTPKKTRRVYVNMRELVEDIGARYSESVAYSYRVSPKSEEITRISYAELAEEVRCIACASVDKGLTSSKVALIGKLSYEWVCSYLSLLSVGATIVPLDADWSEDELAETVKFAECGTLFCTNEVYKSKADTICSKSNIKNTVVINSVSEDSCDGGALSLKGLISHGKELRLNGDLSYETARINPDAVSVIVFTSGTTGKGKGVMLTQTGILSNIVSGLELIEVSGKTLGLLPPHHTFGSTINLLGNLISGAEMYISSGVRYVLKEMQEQKPDHLVLVPLYIESFYKKIMEKVKSTGKEAAIRSLIATSNRALKMGIDIRRKLFASIHQSFGGNLKLIICGGAPISQNIIDFFQSIGITIINAYGITECSPGIAINTNKGKEIGTQGGSCGYPIDVMKVKIDSPNENGEGEICVKGVSVMQGYYKDKQATEAAFDADGYFRTGDYGRFDNKGRLYITGRLKNLIILSNGKNVYPEEIELELASFPGVLEVVVYEGISTRGQEFNTVVAEIYPDVAFLKKEGIEDAFGYYSSLLKDYNHKAIAYKKIGKLKIREEEFPKNTLRKIVRFKIDMSIE